MFSTPVNTEHLLFSQKASKYMNIRLYYEKLDGEQRSTELAV